MNKEKWNEIQREYRSEFLEKFVVKNVLGYGAHGSVFAVDSLFMGRGYAVKRIPIKKNSPDIERALKEVLALDSYDHSGIVRYNNSWIERPPPGWQRLMKRIVCADLETDETELLRFSRLEPIARNTQIRQADDGTIFYVDGKKVHVKTEGQEISVELASITDGKVCFGNALYLEGGDQAYKCVFEPPNAIKVSIVSVPEWMQQQLPIPEGLKSEYIVYFTRYFWIVSRQSRYSEEEVTDAFSRQNSSCLNDDTLLSEFQFARVRDKFGISTLNYPRLTKDNALKEVLALDSFNHPGIVKYNHSWIEEPNKLWHDRKRVFTMRLCLSEFYQCELNCAFLYIVMELCNSTLSTWLSDPTNNVIDLEKMKSWFKQLLSAVAYIHKQGMIHRDLKPSNILFASDDLLKICDLGISASRKIIDDQEVPVSRTFDRGTVKYMAPEQVFDNYRSGRPNTVLSQYPEVFRVNRDIRLLGIRLYVGEGKSRAKASLYRPINDNEKNAEEVAKIYDDDFIHDSRCILAIPFPEPALIRANEWHTISAWINGTASDYGINGKHNVTAGGVAFDFRNSSLPDENYTTADMGQIPELYFLKAEEYEEKIKDNVYGRVAARQAQIDKRVQEYKGENASREDQIQIMRTEMDQLKSALDNALEKLAGIELTNRDQIKSTSDTNTKVEKALADYKQSSEMKYPEQEARINDLENNYKRLRQMFDMNGGSVVNRFREIVPEQWRYYGYYDAIQFRANRDIRLLGITDYWKKFNHPTKCILRLSFAEPVLIRANEWHTICVKIDSKVSDYRKHGMSSVEADGVKAEEYEAVKEKQDNERIREMQAEFEKRFLQSEAALLDLSQKSKMKINEQDKRINELENKYKCLLLKDRLQIDVLSSARTTTQMICLLDFRKARCPSSGRTTAAPPSSCSLHPSQLSSLLNYYDGKREKGRGVLREYELTEEKLKYFSMNSRSLLTENRDELMESRRRILVNIRRKPQLAVTQEIERGESKTGMCGPLTTDYSDRLQIDVLSSARTTTQMICLLDFRKARCPSSGRTTAAPPSSCSLHPSQLSSLLNYYDGKREKGRGVLREYELTEEKLKYFSMNSRSLLTENRDELMESRRRILVNIRRKPQLAARNRKRRKAKLLRFIDDFEEVSIVVATTNEIFHIVYLKYDQESFDGSSNHIVPISFSEPILIRAKEWHIISATISGDNSYRGRCGKSRVEADGVVFDFRHSIRAPTSTTVHSGQFPELYFEENHHDLNDQIQVMRLEIDQLVDENSIKKSKLRIEYKEQVKDMKDWNKKMKNDQDLAVNCSINIRIKELENKYKRLQLMLGRLPKTSHDAALPEMEGCSVLKRFLHTMPGYSYKIVVGGECTDTYPVEAIQFKTGRDIRLMGIGVYVGQKDRARGKLLKVLNDNEDTVEEVSSGESDRGKMGDDRVEAEGAVFEFRDSKLTTVPENQRGRETSIERGQFPEIYFELLSPAEDSPKKEMEYHTKYEEQLKDEEKSKKPQTDQRNVKNCNEAQEYQFMELENKYKRLQLMVARSGNQMQSMQSEIDRLTLKEEASKEKIAQLEKRQQILVAQNEEQTLRIRVMKSEQEQSAQHQATVIEQAERIKELQFGIDKVCDALTECADRAMKAELRNRELTQENERMKKITKWKAVRLSADSRGQA
ncbi:hypothetical protein PRIPAC_96485 [Pristionchus pacificus]|uniref:Protein kinase domain-containing protein n=1 Tax=Pristionchus pacificus TaxID=54126 RepID=A0A2A6B3B8_PRIPA|nr:hypothetical protein PRIPAC_96485 [Pristionchus pacificus]|eukprot:PDM60370.1 protein kinase [Pristionchus pacificus]